MKWLDFQYTRRDDGDDSDAQNNLVLPPELLVHVIRQIENPLERWQTAARLAMAGAFGREWKDHLRTVWSNEAGAIGCSTTAGPYRTVDDLKYAAYMAGYSTRGLKKADLLALIPQTVPPGLVDAARVALRDRRVARDIDAYLNTTDDEGERITATDAKKTYCLNDDDLDDLAYEPRRNPHYRSGPPMRLYEVRDLVVVAIRKHGGQAALVAVQAAANTRRHTRATERHRRREAEKQDRRNDLVEAGVPVDHPIARWYVENGIDTLPYVVACVQRDRDLRAALAQRGLELREDSRLCENYVKRGRGTVHEIVDIMDEMRFYHAHTNYATYRKEIYNRHGYNMDASEISEQAKARAWRILLKRRSKEWLMQHLPPSLCARLVS